VPANQIDIHWNRLELQILRHILFWLPPNRLWLLEYGPARIQPRGRLFSGPAGWPLARSPERDQILQQNDRINSSRCALDQRKGECQRSIKEDTLRTHLTSRGTPACRSQMDVEACAIQQEVRT
jgi:hypothetical protein